MPQNSVALNSVLPTKALSPTLLGVQQDLLVSHFHGTQYHQAYTNALFWGANPSGVTTSAGLATTYVGLILSNPAGNTKNLALRRVSGSFIVAPATVTGVALITGYAAAGVVTHTTPLSPTSAIIGAASTTPTGKLDSAATLVGTPLYTLWLAETSTATTLPFWSVDVEGAIVLQPGAYAAVGTTIAGPASGFQASIFWEEIPV
jgi:hypothetical protein